MSMGLKCSAVAVMTALAAWAQNPSELFTKAPPEVDRALRDRVAKFYQAYVDGKFRAAYDLVAEESKEVYFSQEKSKILSFEILRLNYSENFTKASVATSVERMFTFRGNQMPMKGPVSSWWKIENGEWMWYMPQQDGKPSPFAGAFKPGPGDVNQRTVSGAAGLPRIPTDPSAILSKVGVDKTEVKLKSYEESADEVILTNQLAGSVFVSLDCEKTQGLTVSMDQTELRGGEKARVLFRYEPPNKSPKESLEARLRVEPTNQVIPIKITFAVPPEVQKQISPR